MFPLLILCPVELRNPTPGKNVSVPDSSTGRFARKALCVGVRYGALARRWPEADMMLLEGAHLDAHAMCDLLEGKLSSLRFFFLFFTLLTSLIDIYGYEKRNITLLLDDGVHKMPTRDNIVGSDKNLIIRP